MGACSVPQCSNRSEKGVKIRQCPFNQERRAIWVDYLVKNGFHWTIPKYFFVCEIHFSSFYTNGLSNPKKEDPNVPKGIWKNKNNNVSKNIKILEIFI